MLRKLSAAAMSFAVTPFFAVAPMLAFGSRAAQVDAARVDVVIAATTDTHGRLRAWDYYADTAESTRGLTRIATIVDSVRAANAGRVILVDAGDFLQGNPLTYAAAHIDTARPNPVIAAMNAMHYDAAVVGNHEFDTGLPFLTHTLAEASFPCPCSERASP